MCYLIARKRGFIGCIALRTSHGKHLVDLKRSIMDAVGYEKIELVTISRPSAYVEYEPYHFADTEEEFLKKVREMSKWKIFIGKTQ